ncbi:MAG TPA: hypothetical protein VGG30_00745 [Pirellulales bacterium]|jgi:hypothetical protein
MKNPRPLVALVAVGCVLVVSTTAWACPGCKEALASADGQGGDLVSGFFWSILFMLSMPFLIFGTFCTSMYIAVRRARAAQAKAVAATAQASQPGRTAPHEAPPAGGQSFAGA